MHFQTCLSVSFCLASNFDVGQSRLGPLSPPMLNADGGRAVALLRLCIDIQHTGVNTYDLTENRGNLLRRPTLTTRGLDIRRSPWPNSGRDKDFWAAAHINLLEVKMVEEEPKDLLRHSTALRAVRTCPQRQVVRVVFARIIFRRWHQRCVSTGLTSVCQS